MLKSASRLSFAVVVVFACMQTYTSSVASEYNGNTLRSYKGSSNNTKCRWNCTVIDSDFPERSKTTFDKNRLITLVVNYERKVTEKCIQQTSESSGNTTEYFQVWLPTNNNLSTLDHGMQPLFNYIFSGQSNGQANMKAVCNLDMATDTIASSTTTNDFLSPFVGSHLADHGIEYAANASDCSPEEMPNSIPCITRSNSTMNNTGNHFTEKLGFYLLTLGYFVFFLYYYPAFLCVFSPTRVTESGLRQIVLEGTSPVSFTSFVANFFHSENETIWHKTRMLILRLFVLPLPFLVPAALYAVYITKSGEGETFFITLYSLTKIDIRNIPHGPQTWIIVLLVTYVFHSIYESFFKIQARNAKPCRACRILKPKFDCNSNLPRKILNHLRLQPLIVVKCCSFFKKYLVCYFEMSCLILPSREVTVLGFFRAAGFLVLFTLAPVVTVLVLLAIIVLGVFAIGITSPIIVLCDTWIERVQGVGFRRLAVILLVPIFISTPAFIGSFFVLYLAAFSVAFGIAAALILLLSEESLPFIVLFVLVCYYTWFSYSSFTTKYHDLSLTLFKGYQQNRQRQDPGEAAVVTSNDPEQANSTTSSPIEDSGNVIKIPEELFDRACEELLPVREGVCVLFLKVVSILSCVLGVFFLIMQLDSGATPVMKALMTFFTGSLPKIVTIYVDGGRRKTVDEMVIEERAPKIVQDYIDNCSGAEKSEADIEVIIPDGNEEPIEVVIVENKMTET
ncbi:uncharacterized protein [Montipora capricornis]|uniref:uncharacterized protein n=1 Tax=Montipora capricornis TaxID=246305 RepID=UPI0035F1E345